jgi:hypothetical protein
MIDFVMNSSLKLTCVKTTNINYSCFQVIVIGNRESVLDMQAMLSFCTVWIKITFQ